MAQARLNTWEQQEAEEIISRYTSRKALVTFVYRRLSSHDLDYWFDLFEVETKSQLVNAFANFAKGGK